MSDATNLRAPDAGEGSGARTNPLAPDDPRHGARRGYDLGCRCLKCAIAESRYQAEWSRNGPTRIPAAEVKAHLRRLVKSGWTKSDIAAEAGLGNSTVWHIEHRQTTVNRDTAERIMSLEPLRKDRWIDPEPLKVWLLRKARMSSDGAGIQSMLDNSGIVTSRHWYRCLDAGRIRESTADALAVKVCGLTLEEIYGPDWDEVAA